MSSRPIGSGSAHGDEPVTDHRWIQAKPKVLFVEDESAISEPVQQGARPRGVRARSWPPPPRARSSSPRRLEPDLVLLDLTLPDGDGRDVCRAIRASSDVPILMLTARGTETDRIVGLELGADDYVVKPFSGAEVIARIRAVLRRAARSAAPEDGPSPSPIGDLDVDPGARRVTLDGEELDALAARSSTCSPSWCAHAGRVVTREDLMSRVWDENWFGSTKTLDVHVGWLRRKLGDDPAAPRYLHTVRGVGFRFTRAGGWSEP